MIHLKFFAVCLALLFLEAISLRIHKPEKGPKCEHTFHCGEIHTHITYPFRVEGDPQGCGHPNIQLSCEHNQTFLYLGSNSNKYDVVEYKYYIVEYGMFRDHRSKIRVVDPGMKKNNCSSLPLYSFNLNSYYPLEPAGATDSVIFVSCEKPVKSPFYLDTAPCLTARYSYSYVVVGKTLVAFNIADTCTIYKMITSGFVEYSLDIARRNITFRDIHEAMVSGFELEFGKITYAPYVFTETVGVGIMAIGARAGVGIILLFAFIIYKCRRRHLSIYDAIEEFLQNHNNLIPIRYSYKQIQKMTNNFKEKLGEGGYGSVYKGKLRSGQLVAVKMLTKSKANGQEFINEVATLGRIHHVNVVRLVGFCATTSKHALVYDYMPNGSLDKFIFSECPDGTPLIWKKTFEIARGVARGIEYLHQGCSMQILHFDIKPHNILLDQNFVPKVSDFGLAKLRPVQNSVVSLTAVRGTLGYMAPELFYKNIGNVSNKADVYSFGMLLMEMAGRRRNVKAYAEHSSQIYFPSWIYDKFNQGEDVEIGDHVTEEEEKRIARKLILIAFWCIQMTPTDRPSMRDVLQMLESDIESLQMPPKPQFYPLDPPALEQRSSHSFSDESTESLCGSVAFEME